MSHVGAASASTRRRPSVTPLASSSNVYATSPDDDEPIGRVDEDALVAACVAGRRQQPDDGEHLRLAVVLDVGRTREVDPFGRA